VKAGVREIGTGQEARVEVRLRGGRKLKGHVGEIGDGHFADVDEKTGESVRVPYPQVAGVKGGNRFSGKEIAVTAVVVALYVIPS
jgi:hypothetical protein